MVTEDHRLFLTAVTIDRVDDLLHFAFAQKTIHQLKRSFGIQRQQLTKSNPTRGRHKPLHHFLTGFINLRDPGLDLGVQVHFARVQRMLNLFDGGEDHAFTLHPFTL